MQLLIIFAITAFAGLAALTIIYRSPLAIRIIDTPNERSLHEKPIPRVGGLGVFVALLSGSIAAIYLQFTTSASVKLAIFGYIVLALVSLFDDVRQVSAASRFTAHCVVAAGWLAMTHTFSGSSILFTLVLIGIVWAMNLYNFMDGSDGLAGMTALLGFSTYAVACTLNNNQELQIICVIMMGAISGFLYFNLPPARIFLGDAGSVPLGFLAAVVGIIGFVEGTWSAILPLTVFAMFWVDATFTLARRAKEGKKLWESHKEHWYQKAIQSGSSHRQVLLIHASCTLLLCIVSLISLVLHPHPSYWVQIVWIGSSLVIAIAFGVWSENRSKLNPKKH
jgi:UDP-GlcNAc:undecaprenyl-phosphate/decaprenyl-phosphate GlcNAc-1-phosphate transferase